jgi:hypothetical protein
MLMNAVIDTASNERDMANDSTDQGSAIFGGLTARGLSPVHAAVLVGNMQQESSLDPTQVNPKEDAHGLLQWRLDRWQALQDFAKARGTSPTDRETQLDFIGHEMGGSERKAGSKFMAATDLPSANAALKSYIRYGDNSGDTRLANASRVLGQPASIAQASPSVATSTQTATASPPMGFVPSADTQSPDSMAALISAAQQIGDEAQQSQPLPSALPPMRLGEFPLLAALQARHARGA